MAKQYGYEHYTGRAVTPDVHELAKVPQSIADGWQGFCSCGQWDTFVSFYDFWPPSALHAELSRRFAEHVSSVAHLK